MQILEITKTGYYLASSRGFIEVSSQGEVVGRVVLDDIEAVLVSVPGCSISTVLIDRLANNNIPLVIAGSNYIPSSIVLPLIGKDQQTKPMLAQASLKAPKRKRLWQHIVKAKIANQAMLLNYSGIDAKQLQRIGKRVKSGDPDNCEAQAARYYWPKLMGAAFRRDRDMLGKNAALNYCYAVIRASMARAIVAAGLHPTFSLHHKGPRNPLNLVDDLMEPFRPVADWLVSSHAYSDELDTSDKQRLSSILKIPVAIEGVSSPLSQSCLRFARGLNRVLIGDQDKLELPILLSPIEMAAV